MKVISLFALLLFTSVSYGQTAVISNKSHAGDIAEINKESDNFGEMADIPNYDTVMLIDGNCIVEIGTRWGSMKFQDTICEHWAFEQQGYTLKAAQNRYGSSTEFIGFEDSDDNNDQDRFFGGGVNHNSTFGLFGLVLLSFIAYLITPVFKKR